MAQVGAFKTEMLAGEERDAGRHRLWLSAEAAANGNAAEVLIHNLSTNGLLIETALELELGEEFDLDLPHAGKTGAVVVWSSDSFYGCEFANPVSRAAVSAGILRSSPPASPLPLAAVIPDNDDRPLGADASPALTPRQKLAWIVGLAVACWLPIIVAVAVL